jgi:chorismate dehydratase
MEKIRISAVRYANTYPFIYGLTESGFDKKAIIETDHPSDCAAKLISGRSDLGLIPVAAIPLLKEYHIIGDYCIGADGKVRTVQIMSNSPFKDVEKVYLDYRSRTSVNLVKVIARRFWKKDFTWVNTSKDFVLNTKTSTVTKSIWQRNGRNIRDYHLFLPAGPPTGFFRLILLKILIMHFHWV